MAASLRSQTDVHDTSVSDHRHHLRHAHHRARFPSLTEFPDSPSVYSHTYHSPDTASSDPAGDLELDDETASTIRSLSTEDLQDDSDIDNCTDDASHRISLQGPKIRFHSRAPWETDDVIPHGEESDNSPRSGTIGSKLKGKAARADSLIRTFTRGASLSSRPSVDSARSQVSATSFEITAGNYLGSRGALYDLARQSMSTTSVSSSAASASIRNQSSAPTTNYPDPSHYVPQTHGSFSRATVSLDGMVPPSKPLETASIRPSSSDTSRIGRERSRKFPVRLSQERHSHHDDFVHPYANPDLVAPYTPFPETIPPHHPILGDMSGSDSNSTVTDSISTRSAAFSAISSETSTTSFTTRDFPQGNLRVNGKEISSPISVLRQNDISFVGRNTRFLSLHPPPTGFDGPRRSNNPTVTLLTLQEAQAREKLRSNIVHTTVARPKLPFPNADDIPETAEDQTEEMDTAGVVTHTRVRSTSAGDRQKTLPPAPAQSQITEPTEESPVATSMNAVPGRALKHKKSGFMRLFGSRNSEGDKEKTPPPPALPLGDGYTEQNLQIHGTGKPSKLTRPRVAKPSSSPTLRGLGASSAALSSTNSVSSGGDGPDGKGSSPRRRQAPSLSIVTKTSDQSIATSVAGLGSPTGLNFTSQFPLSLTVPQSAPPGNTDFPGLQLRPVSGSFSSHFADIVASAVEDSQRDVHTPSSAASSSTALSPFTPVSTRRSDDASATVIEMSGEENLTIKELQDQLGSAKKAWQQQIWELRGRVRDLTAELEALRAADNQEYCEVCGRGELPKRRASPLDEQQLKKVGIVNRPRARTGDAARFANGN